jgi:hypothetical protein
MSSERQIVSNRKNAQLSTGPRGLEAKKRTCRNATRHGLSAKRTSSAIGEIARRLAVSLAGDHPPAIVSLYATELAQATATLDRAQTAQIQICSRLGELLTKPSREDVGGQEQVRRRDDLMRKLELAGRYQASAHSRLRRATSQLMRWQIDTRYQRS